MPLDELEPRDVEMSLTINGEVRSTGNGAACLGDPLEALRWLAVQCYRFGDPLRAGHLVLSGALGPFVPFAPGDKVEASISGFETLDRRVQGVDDDQEDRRHRRARATSGPTSCTSCCAAEVIEPRWMIGVDPSSEGLKLAADKGLVSTHEGVDWLLKQDELPDLIFEATSAYVHREYAPRYEEAGIRAVDLTPASVGPAVIPPVNGTEHLGAMNVNMITCGGQATIPMVAAVSRAATVSYAEIVASVSSVSAGPGHPRQHRRVHPDHGGRRRDDRRRRPRQGDHHPQPGRAADDHARHDLLRRPARRRHRRDRPVGLRDGEGGPGVRPGYRLLQEPQIDEPSAATQGQTKVSIFVEVEGAGDYLPPYSGNLDIMTAAAAQVGENIARSHRVSRHRHPRQRTWSGTHGDEPWGKLDLRLTDTCLRDGSHHKRHQFTAQEVHDIVEALDSSGIPVIEVTHGDGLGGSSFNYGFSKTPEQELIKIAAETAKRAKIAFLMLPGVGTKDDIRAAQDNGGQICRIATHCTEADTSIQHFGLARELGLETVGFLMMSHTQPPEVLAKQARIMVDAGCQCVYVVDSAGALIMEQTADRVAAVVAEIGDVADVGFHGHENLGLGVANTVIAARAGATQIDGSVRRFGAGAGNTPARGVHRRLRQARLDDRRRLPRRSSTRPRTSSSRRCPRSASSTG